MDRRLIALSLAGAVVALTGCSSDSRLNSTTAAFDMRHDDTAGYLACRDLAFFLTAEDEDEAVSILRRVVASAAAAKSVAIRMSVTPFPDGDQGEFIDSVDPEDYREVDPEVLYAACEETGFDFSHVDVED